MATTGGRRRRRRQRRQHVLTWETRASLQNYSCCGQSFLFSTKVTILTVSAIEIIPDTVPKPHPSVKDVLPILDTGIIGFLKSF